MTSKRTMHALTVAVADVHEDVDECIEALHRLLPSVPDAQRDVLRDAAGDLADAWRATRHARHLLTTLVPHP